MTNERNTETVTNPETSTTQNFSRRRKAFSRVFAGILLLVPMLVGLQYWQHIYLGASSSSWRASSADPRFEPMSSGEWQSIRENYPELPERYTHPQDVLNDDRVMLASRATPDPEVAGEDLEQRVRALLWKRMVFEEHADWHPRVARWTIEALPNEAFDAAIRDRLLLDRPFDYGEKLGTQPLYRAFVEFDPQTESLRDEFEGTYVEFVKTRRQDVVFAVLAVVLMIVAGGTLFLTVDRKLNGRGRLIVAGAVGMLTAIGIGMAANLLPALIV